MSTINAGYFRSPSIASDRVVFLCEDDVWTVHRDGGVARRLTSNLGPVGRTVVSPDGSFVAFTGTDEAHPEVYVMPAEGGPAVRRTYLGATTQVRGWTPDGRVIFMSDSGRPHRGDTRVYTVHPAEGLPARVEVGQATDVTFAPDGKRSVVGRHTIDPARWKRYRGGTRGDLWIDTRGDGNFRRLVDLGGNLASPMWVGERIYFLSDHEGIGNLYSCTLSGRDVRRHTDHDTYYARWASTDGHRIVYQLAGEIWIYDPETDTSRRIEVDFRSPRIGRNRRFVDAARYLHYYEIHPEGHSLALATRGKLFTMPNWERAPRQFGDRDGVRYRLPAFTFDGAAVVCVSDEGGEEAVEVYEAETARRRARFERVDVGRPLTLACSPVANEAVLTNHRNELLWIDLGTGRSRLLDRSPHRPIGGVSWSPDGTYVAYAFWPTQRTSQIKVAEPRSGRTHEVTRPDFVDVAPAFDPEGKYLYFISYRVFDPVYDSLYFQISFPRAGRPHLVTLRRGEPSPFVPQPRGFAEKPESGPRGGRTKARGRGASDAKDTTPPTPVEIDFEGIADRILAFPIPEGRYTQIAGLKGKVLFVSLPVSGTIGDDIFQTEEGPQGRLEVYDLNELKLDTIVQGVGSFAVSRDGSTLVYRSGSRLRVLKAGEKPDQNAEHEPPGRRSGWIDLGRLRPSVDPPSEYRQMYREAWRFQREHFWVPDMSGVDWQGIYERYRPLVEKVASRLEFSDLMWEMLGELGTSHAYEMGGDVKPPPPYRVGHLAADVTLRDGRWVITHVVRGDSWDPQYTSPLAAPGVDVREGDTVLAVNGQPVGPDRPPQWFLVNQAGVEVELRVGDGRGRRPRTVWVKTLADDMPARYREWVETNRALVHERTQGRVGYVHIPDMGPHGYAEFHRYYMSEVERDALIVDVRFNSGGHVSQLIIEKLVRERIGYIVTRWSARPEPYPSDSPAGPLVCLTNELAGSDGDIFTHVFKLKKLGPVVGKRTWGGVIGIDVRHVLVDNGVTTQPEYSFWFRDVGWGVENYGTDPTHEVDITPQDDAAGRDPQMEVALRLVLRALARHKPLLPDLRTRPRLTPPSLPPRASTSPRRPPGRPRAS